MSLRVSYTHSALQCPHCQKCSRIEKIVQFEFYAGFGAAERFSVRHKKNLPVVDAFGVTTLNNTCAASVCMCGREIDEKHRETERERAKRER